MDHQRKEFEERWECDFACEIPSLEALGLSVATFEKIAMTKIGLVLFVGGIGTGKKQPRPRWVGTAISIHGDISSP